MRDAGWFEGYPKDVYWSIWFKLLLYRGTVLIWSRTPSSIAASHTPGLIPM